MQPRRYHCCPGATTKSLPVLDKTGSLVGMLSAVDLLRGLTDMIDQRQVPTRRGEFNS